MKKNIALEFVCCLIAILFIYASVSKLIDFKLFKIQSGQSPFLKNISGIIAVGLPLMEICTALLLAFSKQRIIGLYSSLFLLSLFTAYLIAMLDFSYYVPCSCGGVLSWLSWKQHILLNTGFMVLNFAGICIESSNGRYAGKLKLTNKQ